jgi:hypothetical protein
MAGLRIVLAACAMALPLWVAQLTPALACSCTDVSLEERVEHAELIVVGAARELRLLGPVPTPKPGPQPIEGPPAEIVISVEEYLKGAGPSSLVVYERDTAVWQGIEPAVRPRSSAACGTFDHIGGRYLLFIYMQGDQLADGGACGGSAEITEYNGVETRIEEVRRMIAAPATPQEPTSTVFQDATKPEVNVATPSVAAFPDTGSGGDGARSLPVTLAIAAAIGVGLASGVLLLGRRG